jgi:hypothetical protein
MALHCLQLQPGLRWQGGGGKDQETPGPGAWATGDSEAAHGGKRRILLQCPLMPVASHPGKAYTVAQANGCRKR